MRQPGKNTMNANNYKAATAKIFYGVLCISILSIIGGFISAIAVLSAVSGGATWYIYVVPILTVVGYVYYFLGLGDLHKEFEGDTADNIKKIRTAAILNIVAALCSMIPVAGGIIGGIINLVAFIMCIMAYGRLRVDANFPGRDGMKTLYTTAILQIIAAVLSIIPLINIIGAILAIIAFIMFIVGWNKVKNANVDTVPVA